MIIMDPEKEHLATTYGDLPPPSTAGKGAAPTLSTTRGRPRLRRLVIRSAISVILWLGLKAYTNRELHADGIWSAPHYPFTRPQNAQPLDHPLRTQEREELFLSIPSPGSALAASRAYATHPHLAGSVEDYYDARVILELFQEELGISPPTSDPIFSAGTPESRDATLHLTKRHHSSNKPSAWIDVYYPVLNTALNHSLEILAEDGSEPVWSAELEEDGDPLDEDAHKYRLSVPTWHGLSKDGTAEGQLVYANYGTKEDYDELDAAGTNLTGKIVITRYGNIFRGLKIKGAEERGAAGVLIYSDPRDDGFVTVQNGYAPYPAGPARNPTSVQRGSVQYLSLYPGDPTTPGYPAYENAERTEGSNIPGIPSLPISWKNAERLLEEIEDYYFPATVGSPRKLSGHASHRKIKLVNHVDTKVTPIWNAMAAIPGHIRDEVVVIGCHRDAWVQGAADPTSGTVSLHEIIRGFGALLRKGWKPLRTVVIASWDAEEYGLVGSTEWGEDFAPWISDHVVAYLNVDVSVSGSRWAVGGSPSLAHIIKQTALDVAHPTIPGRTLWDAQNDHGPFTGLYPLNATADADYLEARSVAEASRQASNTGVFPLGSGSDYTVFLQRLGVASTDQGFGFTATDAVYHYHSIYDSQRWQEIYADVGFHRHVAVAQHLGLLALRLIDAIVLPLNTTQYALELDDYLNKVEDFIPTVALDSAPNFSVLRHAIQNLQAASIELDKEKTEADADFRELLKRMPRWPGGPQCEGRRGVWRRVAKWIKSMFGVPENNTPLHQQTARSVGEWEDYLEYSVDGEGSDSTQVDAPPRLPRPFPIRRFIKAAKRVAKANKKLISFERGFISQGGIKDREWYKHLGVAPGKWLGYGATTLPALTEALSIDHNATLAQHEAARLTTLIENLREVLRQ